MKVKNLKSKNTKIKLQRIKKRVLKIEVKSHRLLSKDKFLNVF